jgi:hypothetical protein
MKDRDAHGHTVSGEASSVNTSKPLRSSHLDAFHQMSDSDAPSGQHLEASLRRRVPEVDTDADND